ncbi:MAG: FtsW/RodA/SpoVE family cell cycle protein [Bacteroidota bacterium]
MQKLLSRLEGDRGIWISVILLLLISLLAIYSSTSTLAQRFQGGNTEHYLLKHTILLIVGLAVIYFSHKLDYRFFARISPFLLGISVLLSAYTLLQGEESAINSANRWINIFGQSFQPSDLSKFSLMVYLALVLTRKQEDIHDFKKGFLPVIGVVMLLIVFIAPADLSTAVLMFLSASMLMFVAGVRLRFIGSLFIAGAIGLLLLFMFAPRVGTWMSRLDDYGERLTSTRYEASYQTQQSNIAIASGGLTGVGAGKSVQRNYLPQPYSDFIYAIIIEEYGMFGGLFVLLLYLVILMRSVAIITFSKTFGALLAMGLSFLLVLQAIINMGVTTGLLPVTGLPLPLISLGGTSMLFTCLAFGVILSVSREARPDDKPTRFSHQPIGA